MNLLPFQKNLQSTCELPIQGMELVCFQTQGCHEKFQDLGCHKTSIMTSRRRYFYANNKLKDIHY